MNRSNILICDLEGPFAHFRKYYTNSSSLSYAFPPPTTIAGLIAGILGLERDSYYDTFSSRNFHSTVEILTPVRKIIQTVNYVFVLSPSDVNKVKGSTQVPFELVVSKYSNKYKYSKIKYRLYLTHKDKRIYNEIKNRLINEAFVYPPYLGVSECLGKLTFAGEVIGDEVKIILPGEKIKVDTVCNIDSIEKGSLGIKLDSGLRYIKEIMPVEFDKSRYLTSSKSYLYEQEGNGIYAVFNVPALSIRLKGETKNIVWLQEVEADDCLFTC